MMAVAPMSTARFASAMLMMPLRQNCLPHFLRTSAMNDFSGLTPALLAGRRHRRSAAAGTAGTDAQWSPRRSHAGMALSHPGSLPRSPQQSEHAETDSIVHGACCAHGADAVQDLPA